MRTPDRLPFRYAFLLLPIAILVAEALGAQSVPVTPTFDCAKVSTESAKLICKDAALAEKERKMAAAHSAVLHRLQPEQRTAFRSSEHYEWFLEYSRTCNAPMAEERRKSCITEA